MQVLLRFPYTRPFVSTSTLTRRVTLLRIPRLLIPARYASKLKEKEHDKRWAKIQKTTYKTPQLACEKYTEMIENYNEVEKPGKCMEVFEEMINKGIPPDVPAYCSLIKAWRVEVDTCFRLFREMKERGLEINKNVYELLLEICEHRGSVHKFEELVDEMEKNGITASGRVLRAQIKMLARRGDMEQSMEVFKEMKSRRMAPDTGVYAALIKGWSKKGEIEKGMKVFQQMNSKPDPLMYDELIKEFGKRGEMDQCLYLLEDMKKWGIHPSIEVLSGVMDALSNAGQMEQCMVLFREMEHSRGLKVTTSVFNIVLAGWRKLRNYDKFHDIFVEMLERKVEPDVGTFNEVMKMWAERVDSKLCIDTLKEMDNRGINPDVDTFRELFNVYMAKGDPNTCIKIFNEMTRRGIKPDSALLKQLNSVLTRQNKIEEEDDEE